MKRRPEHRDEVLHMRIIAAYGEGLFLEMLNELFDERDKFKAENESLRKIANELRRWASCVHVHHDKKDQHEYDQPCKVLARIDAALNRSPENP